MAIYVDGLVQKNKYHPGENLVLVLRWLKKISKGMEEMRDVVKSYFSKNIYWQIIKCCTYTNENG